MKESEQPHFFGCDTPRLRPLQDSGSTRRVSVRLRVRDHEMRSGDYIYEANGVIHEETTAVEDTVHLNIADGPEIFFDDKGLKVYFGWEQVEALKQAAAERAN